MMGLMGKTRSIIRGNAKITDAMRYRIVTSCVLLTHISFIVIFGILNCRPIIIYNAFTVPYYVFIVWTLIKKEKTVLCFGLLYTEVFIANIFSCVVVGWTFGYSLFNLTMIPVSFYLIYMTSDFRHNLRTAGVWTIGNFALTFVARIYVYTHGAVYYYSANVALAVSLYIMLISFALTTFFSVLYVIEIRNGRIVLERKNAELLNLATYDNLTQLLNRYSMQTILENAIHKADNTGEYFTLCLCDIDDFKRVNDTYGHACGDLVLASVAGIIRENVSYQDAVCRWGGEEFIILLKRPAEEAIECIENIRKKIKNNIVEYNDEQLQVSMTFGVEEYRCNADIQELIQRVDEKMYRGKERGKNCVVS